ncbi:response regulator [Brucepastera parasyntrophica]|uniref:response regulator n=1 Tax=Brucepastera parasyntrophica TaxID=2880008 RepID=UPI00210CA6E0|nr:response regulator [Brucepastera parasyntrophica]ULQ58519.1 response regulator [Brucepastera parasyntrophica]
MSKFTLDDYFASSPGLSVEAMETLADYAGIGLLNWHIPSGKISLNRNITLLAGYEPGDLPHTGNTREMLTYEPDRAMVSESIRAVLAGEKDRYRIEYRMRRADGSLVWVSETGIVYERDKSGKPVRLAGLSVELTRLKWAEEKARDMELEVKRLSAGTGDAGLAEQNRMLRAANAASATIIGGFHQDYETVVRQSLQILAESIQTQRAYIFRNITVDGRLCCYPRTEWYLDHPSGRAQGPEYAMVYDEFLPNWREITNKYASMRLSMENPDRELVNLPHTEDVKSIMLIPLFLQGEFWGFIGFDDTLTGREFTRDEADIMRAGAMVVASSLTRNETFSKLNEAREEAMASTKAKGEFLSRMSHEIRTPMNAIIGMAAIARKTTDPEKIQYCLEKVDASSRQLLGIINDVLDMSKIDSGKFEITLHPFDFEQMMQDVFNVIQVRLEEKKQTIHYDFTTVFKNKIISDELRLSQVLINLLNNAVKFTPERGDITLMVREQPGETGGSLLHVEVIDNGIGISHEQQERLFQSFEQADGSITRRYGGTGLGLAICKKIINLMDGDIWVESEEGKGSRFIFEFPVSWGDPIPAASILRKAAPTSRILVVDDAEDVRMYFKNILDTFSLSCDAADSGEEALALVRQSLRDKKPYSMVFIDWNMPGMNGGDTAMELRHLLGEDLLVVMISVSDWTDIEQSAKNYGITHFLPKPVLPSTLYNTIVELADDTLIQEGRQTTDTPDWKGRTILLAEDIAINQEIVIALLEGTGASVICADNGEIALDLFREDPERYDLILMDMQMPVMDGICAAEQIRSLDDPAAKTVPIVAMTANAFKEDEQRCFDAGMNGHLAKPLEIDSFFRVLDKYLR